MDVECILSTCLSRVSACSARSDTPTAAYEDQNLSELKGRVKVVAQCAISVAASVRAGYQEVSFTEQARDERSDVADSWTVHCMRAWGTKCTSDHMSCTKYQLRRKSFSVMWAECRRQVVVNRVECRMNVFAFGSLPKKARALLMEPDQVDLEKLEQFRLSSAALSSPRERSENNHFFQLLVFPGHLGHVTQRRCRFGMGGRGGVHGKCSRAQCFSLSFSFWFMSDPQLCRFRIAAQQWRREVRFSL